jgi:phosphoribosyl 1,2-cyclic phosphodiesterase
MPVYMTKPTLDVVGKKKATGVLSEVHHFRSGQPIEFDDVVVHTIRTPHDAADGVCFVVEDLQTGARFGLLTDLGHAFKGLSNWIATLDAVLIESNYDLPMLRDGFYARHLKERIHGKRGHLSNSDAAKLVRDHASDSLQWVCLGHLSDENNTPEIAMKTCRQYVRDDLDVICANRCDVIDPMIVRPPVNQRQVRRRGGTRQASLF